MDSYENEASKFAAQRTKLKNICEAHDLTYTFIKNSYPIKLIIRPIKGVGEQMSMLETASEDSYISPDAYLLFTMKDGVLVYRMSKTFTIEDLLNSFFVCHCASSLNISTNRMVCEPVTTPPGQLEPVCEQLTRAIVLAGRGGHVPIPHEPLLHFVLGVAVQLIR